MNVFLKILGGMQRNYLFNRPLYVRQSSYCFCRYIHNIHTYIYCIIYRISSFKHGLYTVILCRLQAHYSLNHNRVFPTVKIYCCKLSNNIFFFYFQCLTTWHTYQPYIVCFCFVFQTINVNINVQRPSIIIVDVLINYFIIVLLYVNTIYKLHTTIISII